MGRLKELLLSLLSGGIGLFITIFCLLSIPFNMIVLMRWYDLQWWTAFIAVTVMSAIPLIGQLAFVVFAFMGANYLYQADFDWRKAATAPTNISIAPTPGPKRDPAISQLSPAQFAEYAQNVLRPQMRESCIQGAKSDVNFGGKSPTFASTYCDCQVRVKLEQLSQKDWIESDRDEKLLPAIQQKVTKAVADECWPKAFRRPG